MSEEIITELQEIQANILMIQHRLLGVGGLLEAAGKSSQPLNDTEVIGVGYCLYDIAGKLVNEFDPGIMDRLDGIEKKLKKQKAKLAVVE